MKNGSAIFDVALFAVVFIASIIRRCAVHRFPLFAKRRSNLAPGGFLRVQATKIRAVVRKFC